MTTNSGWVPVKAVKPHLIELIQRYDGSIRGTAEAIGVSDTALGKILNDERTQVQKETARAIIDGLLLKRQIDRRNHHVSEARIKAIRQQAYIEERLERLSGY